MSETRWAKSIAKIRSWRKALDDAFLAAFRPRLFDARTCDEQLADDVKKRWPDHSLSIQCLVHERDDWKRYHKVVASGDANAEAPDPTQPDFLVFIDPTDSVDWTGSPDSTAASLISQAEAVASVDCAFLKRSKLLEFRIQVAHAIVCALQGEIDEASKLLNQAKNYLSKRTVERSREWTLLSVLVLGLLAAFATFLFGETAFSAGLSQSGAASILGGFCGAFASIAARTGKSNWDAAAGFRIHFLEAGMRLVVGSIFGFAATALASSSFGPEPLQNLVKTWEGCAIAAFGAGWFEHSIPRILSQYSRDQALNIGDADDDKKGNPN